MEAFELSKYRMRNMIFRYKDKYYQYRRELDNEDIRTTIGGYESAFYTDIDSQYIFENLSNYLRSTCIYYMLYRDDGVLIFKKVMSFAEVEEWL